MEGQGGGGTQRIPSPALQSPRSVLATGSYGDRVHRWMQRRLRMTLGAWQFYAIDRLLEHDAQGDLLVKLGLISVARQNGKSVIVRAIVGWMLDEGYKLPAFKEWNFILLAAHDAKQARIPYEFIRRDLLLHTQIAGLQGRFADRNPKRATLKEGIELNGIRVDVASAREGSTRGVSPGLICFDEVLTQVSFSMYEVLSPSLSAMRNSFMLMTSTAGFADSVVLRTMHDRLLRQSTGEEPHDPAFMGLWWRAADDDIGLDWDALYPANPALYDGRLSRASIATEHSILPHGSWIRERLNRWADERVDAPFNLQAWGACRAPYPLDPSFVADKYVIGFDVTSNWSEGAIIVAALRRDGKVGIEVHRHLEAHGGALTAAHFVEQAVNLAGKLPLEAIAYSASSALAPALERHKVQSQLPYVAVSSTDMQKACEDFAEAVISNRLVHGDPYLDSQIAKAQRRFVGSDGAWRWAISQTPINGVVAMTMASALAAKQSAPVQVFI